ncbi:hypothetical protein UlMin_025011, partial [Ulmus minor]
VVVTIVSGYSISASVPSGAPAGSNLWEVVREAVEFVNTVISPALTGKHPLQQAVIDNIMVRKLEEIRNERGSGALKFGASAIFAVSLAVSRAAGFVLYQPLYKRIATLAGNKKLIMPIPVSNVINEFTIHPVGSSSFDDASLVTWNIFYNVKEVVRKEYGQFCVCNEVCHGGGISPKFKDVTDGLKLLNEAISSSRHSDKVVIGVDAAASEFYELDKTYRPNFSGENNGFSQRVSGDALKDFYKSLVRDYNVASIEEPFDKDDCESYSKLTTEIGERVQIVGDEFLVTDPKRIEHAIKEKTCNTLLIKVKHLSSVTETIKAVKMVKEAGWGVILASHGSGETDDTFVGPLAVGLGATQINAGFYCKHERCSIYNELRTIERMIGRGGHGRDFYVGGDFKTPSE